MSESGISYNGSGSDMSNSGVIISNSATPLPEGVHLPLYMDNHATTRTDPRVLEAMLPFFSRDLWQCGQPQP
jgi:hypothetical protein